MFGCPDHLAVWMLVSWWSDGGQSMASEDLDCNAALRLWFLGSGVVVRLWLDGGGMGF